MRLGVEDATEAVSVPEVSGVFPEKIAQDEGQ